MHLILWSSTLVVGDSPVAIAASRVFAPTNVALIKYWGKRDPLQNLPRSSSLSATLSSLGSYATVEFSDRDEIIVEGDPIRAKRVLMAARAFTGNLVHLRIWIENTMPTGAGLASSASSMAALALALARLLGPDIPEEEIERWARLGSGSAVRSLYPGYVLWEAGKAPDGSDCRAYSVIPPNHLPLGLVVCIVDDRPKSVDSTTAMERCRLTSPLFDQFHSSIPLEIAAMLKALRSRDLNAIARIAERNSLAMHEVMRAAIPPIDFIGQASLEVIAMVRALREQGVACFFTIDAGPNVKVFTPIENLSTVKSACATLSGVKRLLVDRVGPIGEQT